MRAINYLTLFILILLVLFIYVETDYVNNSINTLLKSCVIIQINFTANSLFTAVQLDVAPNKNGIGCDNIKNESLFAELLYRSNDVFTVIRGSGADFDNNVIGNVKQLDHMAFGYSEKPITAKFPCSALVNPGFYAIRVTDRHNHTINEDFEWSRVERVGSSSDASNPLVLWLRNDSIFPSCKDHFTVSWLLPSTCGRTDLEDVIDFRVRVFAAALPDDVQWTPVKNLFLSTYYKLDKQSRWKRDDLTADRSWLYLGELAARWTNNYHALLSIPCVQFDIIYESFCFELVSIARQSRHIEMMDKQCVRTEPQIIASHEKSAYWSSWSAWSSCHSCGSRIKSACCNDGKIGYRKRRRSCLSGNSSNTNRVIGCTGAKFSEVECCEFTSPSNAFELEPEALHAAKISISKSKCVCGCDLAALFGNKTSGAFFAIKNVECKQNYSAWYLRPPSSSTQFKRMLMATVSATESKFSKLLILHVFARSQHDQRLLWSSEVFTDQNAEVMGNTVVFHSIIDPNEELIFNIIDRPRSRKSIADVKGFYIDFVIKYSNESNSRGDTDEFASPSKFRALISAGLFAFIECDLDSKENEICDRKLALITIFCSLSLLIFVVCFPPIVCAFLSRRLRATRYKACSTKLQTHVIRDLLSPSRGKNFRSSEMLHSGGSNSTQITDCGLTMAPLIEKPTCLRDSSDLSVTKLVKKRSISIQLSRQSTPRLTSWNDLNNNNNEYHKSKLYDCVNEQPISSDTTEPTKLDDLADYCGTESGADGLEYDYYEPPPMPTSFLASMKSRTGNASQEEYCEFVSEIDIDEIIREEAPSMSIGWLAVGSARWSSERHAFATQDAHTQI